MGTGRREQGQRSQQQRQELARQTGRAEGQVQQDRDVQMQLPLEPFTSVIELDAWNSPERDGWRHRFHLRRDHDHQGEPCPEGNLQLLFEIHCSIFLYVGCVRLMSK